jgi:hypothetical protein
MLTIERPTNTPIKDKKLTIPLHNTVWAPVNELRNNMTTSPSYLGISCATMAITTGMI